MRQRLLAGTRRRSAAARTGREGQQGFTLVELLVVLAIIALIAGLAAPQVLRYLGSARTEAAIAQIRNIESALELFYIDNLRYPTSEEGLIVLAQSSPALAGRWKGPYLANAEALRDPWGNAYIYRYADDRVLIMSLGRDGREGGSGEDRDITN